MPRTGSEGDVVLHLCHKLMSYEGLFSAQEMRVKSSFNCVTNL